MEAGAAAAWVGATGVGESSVAGMEGAAKVVAAKVVAASSRLLELEAAVRVAGWGAGVAGWVVEVATEMAIWAAQEEAVAAQGVAELEVVGLLAVAVKAAGLAQYRSHRLWLLSRQSSKLDAAYIRARRKCKFLRHLHRMQSS